MAFGKTMGPFAFAPQAVAINKGGSAICPRTRSISAAPARSNRRWDDAVEYFNQAAVKGGDRTDGALYWKAYALTQGRQASEAEAALTELQTKHCRQPLG